MRRSILSGGFSGSTKTTTDGTKVTPIIDVGLAAGERRIDDPDNSYVVVRQEASLTVISKTTAVTIGGGAPGDTQLMGVMFGVALTGSCVIAGFADSDDAAKSVTIAAGAIGLYNFFGAVNAKAALTVTCSNAADDDDVYVFWKAV